MKLLICNLKMNYLLPDIIEYKNKLNKVDCKDNLLICPSYCYLPIMHARNYLIGAQDVSENENGSFTGQVSVEMLKSLDVRGILLNHKEINNNLEIVKKKLIRCLKYKIPVYIFISETVYEHYYQYTVEKLLEQIEYLIKDINKENYSLISFVYEPSWLIGKNTSLNSATIKNLFYILKKEFKYQYNYNFKLLYGGGLKEDVIRELNSFAMIDGFVLGNMSLDIEKVINIIKILK